MMDEKPDRFEEFVRDAAREYHPPPPTPKAELWERIQAARQAAPAGRDDHDIRPLPPGGAPRVRPVWYFGLAAAAILAVGIAIGRTSAPSAGGRDTVPAVSAAAETEERRERGELATRLVAVQHLTEVDVFLTEFRSRDGEAAEFTGQASDLLGTTRLLIDSRRITDPRLKSLLEDLEGVLAQIATFDSTDRRNELELIDDGMAQTHLRTRLKNVIPAGPVRM